MLKIAVENNGPEYALDPVGVGEWVMNRYGRSQYQRGRRKLNDKGSFLFNKFRIILLEIFYNFEENI